MKRTAYAFIAALALLLAACDRAEKQPATDAGAGEGEQPAAEAVSTAAPASNAAATAIVPSKPTETPEPGSPTVSTEPFDVSIEGADDLAIAATFYPGAGSPPWPGVMLLHMNGGSRRDWQQVAGRLADEGYAALAVDMRAHGETGGRRDWVKAGEDLLLVWDYLAGRDDVDESRTAVAGASIGANMSLVTAVAQPAIKTAILLSPGLNYFDVTTDDAVVAYGDRPLLIVASREDGEAARSSEKLHELAPENSQLQMYQGAGHGTRMFGPQPDLVDLITQWLDQHLTGEGAAQATGATLPASTLFNVDWEDRSIFRGGLVDAERSVLEQLPGASVYHLDLAIASDLESVTGRQEVFYTNQEAIPLDALHFHLFPNLLGGSIAISEVTVDGSAVSPDFLNQRSVLRVPLARPLQPGEQSVIKMTYDVTIPQENSENAGVFATVDGIMALAHFYPQISVYDDEGWNIDYPSPNADVTYAEASFYLVRVAAPAEQVLVTTGNTLDRQVEGDRQILTIAAGPARDFYIASSADYTVVSQSVGQTTVNSYGLPQFRERIDQTLSVAVAALESFNRRLGLYPYTEFDVAPTYFLSLGVEYPGAVVLRAELYDPEALLGETPAGFFLEGTMAHEVGHQWFYGVAGNDQLDEPWLDEALTQYITYLYYVDTYGRNGAEGFRQNFIDRWDRVEGADIPIGLPASAYEGLEYGAIVYGRGPLFFEALAEVMGEPVFGAFLRDHYQQNKWGIATGPMLKALAEAHCACDLTPIFAEWVG